MTLFSYLRRRPATPRSATVRRLRDRDLKRNLVADLQEEPATRGERIRVDVVQHVVVLGGEVSCQTARDVATRHARASAQVEAVLSRIAVSAGSAASPSRTSHRGGRGTPSPA